MLGLGRTSGYPIGMRCRSVWKALERCNDARRSLGRAERYACVAGPLADAGLRRAITSRILMCPVRSLKGTGDCGYVLIYDPPLAAAHLEPRRVRVEVADADLAAFVGQSEDQLPR